MNQSSNFHWLYGVHTVDSIIKNASKSVSCVYVLHTNKKRVTHKKLGQIIKHAQAQGIDIKAQSKEWLDKHSGDGNHQGIVVSCKPIQGLVESDVVSFLQSCSHSPLVLVLDKIQDPHNLGACFRNAEAFGVDLIIFAKSGSVGLTPTVHKVASGATFTVPFLEAGNVSRIIKLLQQAGLWFIATTLKAGAQDLVTCDLTIPTGIVIGSEGVGVSAKIEQMCDYQAYIPMQGNLNSLNLSAACAIALYETQRQRQAKNKS